MKGQQAIGTLVIFIALVITAALASFVLVSTTNTLQSKSLAVASKTMEKSTMGFAARAVDGWADDGDSKLDLITFQIELAPGSDTIDLKDATIIYQAAGGTVYQEYSVKEYNAADATTYAETNTAALDGTGDDVIVLGDGSTITATDTAYIVKDRTHYEGSDIDMYVSSGELYTLVIKLPTALKEGQDWKIIVRTPYTQDLVITGYAPEVIQAGQAVPLKSA